MAYTVREGFNTFRAHIVDLAPDETKMGRASRDYLVGQIKVVAKNNAAFPRLGEDYRAYGSFARRTKIRPLDDIDLLLVLNGRKTAEASASGLNTYRLKITDPTAPNLAVSSLTFGRHSHGRINAGQAHDRSPCLVCWQADRPLCWLLSRPKIWR